MRRVSSTPNAYVVLGRCMQVSSCLSLEFNMPYLFYRYSVMDLRWRSFARELLQRQRDPWKDTSDEDMIHILCRFDNWSTRVLQTKSREFLLAMCSMYTGLYSPHQWLPGYTADIGLLHQLWSSHFWLTALEDEHEWEDFVS